MTKKIQGNEFFEAVKKIRILYDLRNRGYSDIYLVNWHIACHFAQDACKDLIPHLGDFTVECSAARHDSWYFELGYNGTLYLAITSSSYAISWIM